MAIGRTTIGWNFMEPHFLLSFFFSTENGLLKKLVCQFVILGMEQRHFTRSVEMCQLFKGVIYVIYSIKLYANLSTTFILILNNY